jgi:hypothetical protein
MEVRGLNLRVFLVLLWSTAITTVGFSSTVSAERWAVKINEPGLSGSISTGPDFDDLAQRLRQTEALGLFEKLALKDRLDTLMSDFVLFHEGRRDNSRKALKARFDRLLKDTVAILRKGDPSLSTLIERAHKNLWMLVSNPVSFAAMKEQQTAYGDDDRADRGADAGG